MTRLVATLLLAAALTGCASKSETAAPAGQAAATTAAGAASPARTKACQQFTAFFTSLREQAKTSGSGWTPDKGVEELLSTMKQSPSWASTSEADRDATVAGIKDAANGTSCG